MVNGKPIMRSDMETLYRRNLGDSKQEPPKDQADNVRLNIVREQIDEEIVAQRAAKLNLTATDDEVETKLAEMKAPYTQEEFDQKLKSEHLTLDDLKKEIRKNRTYEKLFNKEINSKINITDADITNYYNAHKADFNLIEPRYHLAEIAVTPQPAPAQQQQPINMQNSKASNDAEARKKIEGLHSRLESGEDFGTLAANFSEDPNTASNGGDMGGIMRVGVAQAAGGLRGDQQAEAGPDHSGAGDPGRPGIQQGWNLLHLQADRPRGGGTARDERSPRAADDSRRAAAGAVDSAQERLHRDAARPGACRELLRRRDLQERRSVTAISQDTIDDSLRNSWLRPPCGKAAGAGICRVLSNRSLVGLWRRDFAKAQANARDFKIEHAFETAEALCASPEIDAVFVASPDALHLHDVLLALKHGKPVLCEKPLAMNAAEVEAMLAAQAKAGVAFGVAQNMRYNASAAVDAAMDCRGTHRETGAGALAVLLRGGTESAAMDL